MKIIEENPYRLLGVYSNSPTRERLANLNRMKAFLKVGRTVSFPLDLQQYLSVINRTETSVADAEAKLTLPKEQISYAQFWFVKMTPLDDVAFNHLFAGEIDKAEEIWKKRECLSSLQNLIVCALIRGKYAEVISLAETLYSNMQYINQLAAVVVGTGGGSNVSDLVFSFIDVLCDEIDVDELLLFTTNATWKDHIKEKAVKPIIEHIQDSIDVAQKSKGKGSTARYEAGKVLMNDTKQFISQLENLLSKTEIQYQTIVDKLGLEILQCGIDYYNDSEEPDAAKKAMVLQRYAKSIVVGQMAKDRCKENVDILQKIIDNLPPLEVFAEDKAIREELSKYRLLPNEVCNAITLLYNTKPHLKDIRRKLGVSNAYYLRISTQVVDNALNNVIVDVNKRQRNAIKKVLKRKLKEAIKAIKVMSGFDMQHDFRIGRFDENKKILYNNYAKFDNSSKWQAALILHFIFVVVGSIFVSKDDGFDDSAYFWLIAIGAIPWTYIIVDDNNESAGLLEFLSRGGCVGVLLILPVFLGYWLYKAIKELLNLIKQK